MTEFDKKLQEVKPKETQSTLDLLKNVDRNVREKTKKAVSVWYFWANTVLMTLLSLLIIGMYQLVIADFDPKIYTTPEFWGNYLSYQTASWILTFNIINTAYKVLKKRNERYNALKNKKNFYVTVDEQKAFIGINAEEEARRRKIKAWKIYINRKLINLVQKHKIYDLKAFITKDINLLTSKKQKRIRAKIDGLLYRLTDKWIDENIETVKANGWFGFKYANVTREKLVSGGHVIESNYGESDFKEHNARVFADYYLSGFLFMSVLIFIILSFTISYKEATFETWLTIAIKSFMLFGNAMMTLFKTDDTFSLTKLKVLEETTSELSRYYNKSFTEDERKAFEIQFNKLDKNNDTL